MSVRSATANTVYFPLTKTIANLDSFLFLKTTWNSSNVQSVESLFKNSRDAIILSVSVGFNSVTYVVNHGLPGTIKITTSKETFSCFDLKGKK